MCPWHAWRFSLQDGTWLEQFTQRYSNRLL
ncbi:MAG UNVERIFIED_CONTAM: hypothetical protein LVR18_25350 [Planctomycetaceae bacterium]